jgi:hypothetical protein
VIAYLQRRLLEWSTIRGLLLFAGSALGLDLSDQDWDVLYQAYEIASGAVKDLADSDRLRVSLGVLLQTTNLAGLVGMLMPDKVTGELWRALRGEKA